MNLKNLIENNKQKIITYLMVYLIIPALLYTPTVMFSDKLMDNILRSIMLLFLLYIGMILFFLPTYLVLDFFLFKKIKNIKTRYFLFSISIPLTMLVYFLIIHLPFVDDISTDMGVNTLLFIIGLFWMLFVLPMSFMTTLCTPKKYLDEKYYNLACIFLTEIFGGIFFIITLFIAGYAGLFN